MIDFDFEENCCGCGSCAAICPVDAIAMKSDKNAFPFPSVDSKKCIHCNRCDCVCPHLKKTILPGSSHQKMTMQK